MRPGRHWLCEFADAGNDQQSGGGCVRTHVPRVDTGCSHITTTGGYDHKFK